VIYTPYEGIFTPVFRGSPWPVSFPHNYVLFEWDTYLSSFMAVHSDRWTAINNIVRMTKSLNYQGFVAGFWNGKCGEVDKSKPPVGGLALQHFLRHNPKDMWIAELLLPQFVSWSRWWAAARQFDVVAHGKNTSNAGGLYAPGSTRANQHIAIACTKAGQESPEGASRCETGLDNSPLYDGAKFVAGEDVLDQVDVGMTALYAEDCFTLANVSRQLGHTAFAEELQARGAGLVSQINANLWNDDAGVYVNKNWQTNSWVKNSQHSNGLTIAPTNLYPMLAGAPTDRQVERMLSRWLTNGSEFAVNSAQKYGMPSVSRSWCGGGNCTKGGSYWRGRAWGPMNLLIYLGLRRFDHLPSAKQAMADLAAQSEATFLIEWIPNHRVMENFNSVDGVGCDVHNAIPFYHCGSCTALVALMHSGALG
jgi:putative isomerase